MQIINVYFVNKLPYLIFNILEEKKGYKNIKHYVDEAMC